MLKQEIKYIKYHYKSFSLKLQKNSINLSTVTGFEVLAICRYRNGYNIRPVYETVTSWFARTTGYSVFLFTKARDNSV